MNPVASTLFPEDQMKKTMADYLQESKAPTSTKFKRKNRKHAHPTTDAVDDPSTFLTEAFLSSAPIEAKYGPDGEENTPDKPKTKVS